MSAPGNDSSGRNKNKTRVIFLKNKKRKETKAIRDGWLEYFKFVQETEKGNCLILLSAE